MFDFINTVLGVPLGYIMYLAYELTGSYGLAVIIFSVFVSIVLYPVNLLAHKNSIRLLQLQPNLFSIKQQFAGDNARLNEEQYNLFKREKYSPFVGIIPLLIQLFLVIGMLQVMYHPLQHILRFSPEIIDILVQTHRNITGTSGGMGEQVMVLESVHSTVNISAFIVALAQYPNAQEIINVANSLYLYFLGLNFGAVPSFGGALYLLLIPMLSGVTAFIFCYFQSGISPGALTSGSKANRFLTIFTVVFSIYFAFVTPVGVGIYWTIRNILGTVVIFVLDKLYSPKRLAPEALVHLEAIKKTPNELKAEREQKKILAVREKIDVSRFMKAKKGLVFYALSGGQFKYYKTIIDYILNNSSETIHYLTNDYTDAIFEFNHKRLVSYYIGQQKTVSVLLRLDCEIFATTVPDLNVFHMKRSVARLDIEYIFIQHGMGSTHLAAREEAQDHFDTVFCVGQHQIDETRRHEELTGISQKSLVKSGYVMYDTVLESYKSMSPKNDNKARILIAPSWQDNNIMDLCLDRMLESLLGKGHVVYVRPHPQYLRMFPDKMKTLHENNDSYIKAGELIIDTNFLSNESILTADIVITDWSNIAFEFSYVTLKPCIFVNTPIKILNPRYEEYGIEALEVSLRNRVGKSLEVDSVSEINDMVIELLHEKDVYRKKIEEVVSKYLFYPGRSGEAGGRYILNQLDVKDGH